MALPNDAVKPLKANASTNLAEPLNVNTDAIATRAVYVQPASGTDDTVSIARDSNGNLTFADEATASTTLNTLASKVSAINVNAPLTISGTTSPTLGLSTPLSLTYGGTGTSQLASGSFLYVNSNATALAGVQPSAANTFPYWDGSAWTTSTTTSLGTVTSVALSSTSGLTFSGAVTASGTITVGGTLSIANGGTGQTSKAAAFDALAPTTAKGDIISHNGTTNVRHPVGPDGSVLYADANASAGIRWGSTGSAGAFAYWGETLSTASPNTTTNVASLGAVGTTTNVDVAIVPKGTGAFMLAVPDGTATGGNKRGTSAVDLQRSRTAATQVSSGSQSFIGAGQNNTASGVNSAVVAGSGNLASGQFSFIGAGQSNTASATAAFVGAGVSNTASGQYSSVVGGTNNIADANYSVVLGGRYGTTHGTLARVVFPLQALASVNPQGGTQSSMLMLAGQTTNATPLNLTVDGNSATTTVPRNVLYIPSGCVVAIHADVVARNTSTNALMAWRLEGAAFNNAGTVSILSGAPDAVVLANTDNTSWTVALAAGNSAPATNCVHIVATGAAATTIDWVAVMYTAEMIR